MGHGGSHEVGPIHFARCCFRDYRPSVGQCRHVWTIFAPAQSLGATCNLPVLWPGLSLGYVKTVLPGMGKTSLAYASSDATVVI